ncbi:hypothetical protein CsSME_00041806 [Camellia sinensis var. sinensis]
MSALEIVCIFYLKHAFILRFPANRSDNFMKQSQIVEFSYVTYIDVSCMMDEWQEEKEQDEGQLKGFGSATEVLESGAIWMPEELVILHAIIQW